MADRPLLAVVTGSVDYLMHPGQLGPGPTEAVITGLGAGALSLLVKLVLGQLKRLRTVRQTEG